MTTDTKSGNDVQNDDYIKPVFDLRAYYFGETERKFDLRNLQGTFVLSLTPKLARDFLNAADSVAVPPLNLSFSPKQAEEILDTLLRKNKTIKNGFLSQLTTKLAEDAKEAGAFDLNMNQDMAVRFVKTMLTAEGEPECDFPPLKIQFDERIAEKLIACFQDTNYYLELIASKLQHHLEKQSGQKNEKVSA